MQSLATCAAIATAHQVQTQAVPKPVAKWLISQMCEQAVVTAVNQPKQSSQAFQASQYILWGTGRLYAKFDASSVKEQREIASYSVEHQHVSVKPAENTSMSASSDTAGEGLIIFQAHLFHT